MTHMCRGRAVGVFWGSTVSHAAVNSETQVECYTDPSAQLSMSCRGRSAR